MKSAPSLVKYLTLACFIILLCGFVAYRSGAFDKYLHKKNADYVLAFNASDTSGKPDTIIPGKRMMSGSKAMVLSENSLFSRVKRLNPSAPADTAQYMALYRELKRIKNEDSVKQEKEIIRMSSSKSAVIIKPEDMPEKRYLRQELQLINGTYYYLSMYQVDSLLREMDKKSAAQSIPEDVKTILSGSKSLLPPPTNRKNN